MPSPAPNSSLPFPNRSWLTTMTSLATRTLWECQPSGTAICARTFGWRGSATSTIVVPYGLRMWPTYIVVPSTQTWPPPGQSKWPISVVFQDLAMPGAVSRSRRAPPLGSDETNDVAAGLAAPFLVEAESAQRRLVAGDEEDRGVALGAVDV